MDIRRIHLPYCLQRQSDGSYILLNRSYKPLGFMTSEHVDYLSYPIAIQIKGLTERVAAKLSWNSNKDLTAIYLYNDGCIPTKSTKYMRAYLDKLAQLSKLKISTHKK